MILAQIWHDWLYTPLLNLLFFLYGGPAFGNLGLAIVELTVLLRLALLPFTVLEERSGWRYDLIREKLDSVARDFKNDAVRRKEKVRELLAEHRINYWSKSVTLIVQGVVLVLLYQVFIGGIRFTSHESLYSWVSPPADVNTDFFGWDISERSLVWAAAVGVFLFVSIYLNLRKESRVTRGDVLYAVGFPVFSALVLLLLPMMKSLFIMTSLVFGRLVHLTRLYFLKSAKS